VAGLSSTVLSFLSARRDGSSPRSERKWKQVEAPTPRGGLIIGTQCCNGWSGLDIYPVQFLVTQRSGALTGSFAQRLSSA
jgi:hypothetical protein